MKKIATVLKYLFSVVFGLLCAFIILMIFIPTETEDISFLVFLAVVAALFFAITVLLVRSANKGRKKEPTVFPSDGFAPPAGPIAPVEPAETFAPADFILDNAPSSSAPAENTALAHSSELAILKKEDEDDPLLDVESLDNDDYYESEPTEAFQKQMEREKQIESFSISDMDQFVDIPFAWSQVMQLQHSQRKAWMQLNMNNQQVALDYIMQVNQLIVDSHAFVDGISSLSISPDDIDFWFPVPMKKDSINNTYIECTPYTPTGKISKYPATIHFASTRLVTLANGAQFQEYPITGIIKILRDGNIGLADVVFSDNNSPLARYEVRDPKFTRFRIGLFGLALVVKRIDNEKGNLFKFEDFKKKYMV